MFQITDYDELRLKENGIFARMIKDQAIEKGEEISSSSESEDSFQTVDVYKPEKEIITDT